MTAYEIFLVIVFGVLTIVFAWKSTISYQRANTEKDENQRKIIRKKAFLLMALALIFLLCTLYVIFRVSWLFFIVFLLGCAVVAYAVGSGIGENMKKH